MKDIVEDYYCFICTSWNERKKSARLSESIVDSRYSSNRLLSVPDMRKETYEPNATIVVLYTVLHRKDTGSGLALCD
jgi:hypothetical protein